MRTDACLSSLHDDSNSSCFLLIVMVPCVFKQPRPSTILDLSWSRCRSNADGIFALKFHYGNIDGMDNACIWISIFVTFAQLVVSCGRYTIKDNYLCKIYLCSCWWSWIICISYFGVVRLVNCIGTGVVGLIRAQKLYIYTNVCRQLI